MVSGMNNFWQGEHWCCDYVFKRTVCTFGAMIHPDILASESPDAWGLCRGAGGGWELPGNAAAAVSHFLPASCLKFRRVESEEKTPNEILAFI